MFGRRPPVLQNYVNDNITIHDLHNRIAQREVDEMRANAVASTSDAQQRSRQYFDDRNRPLQFNVGDKVLTRRSDRRAKLSNRYEGPFEIVSLENDIYKLRSATGETRIRHVSALEKFTERDEMNANILLLILLSSSVGANHILIEEAPPVIHELDDTKYVTEETAYYTVELFEESSCEALLGCCIERGGSKSGRHPRHCFRHPLYSKK